MKTHLSPAQYVIKVFKGVRATARAIGRTPGSVSKWTKDGEGGTSGQIPRKAAAQILFKARELQLDITPQDLMFGREVGE